MCGIWLYLKKKNYISKISEEILYEYCNKSKNRGPDQSQYIKLLENDLIIGFHRLAIMDLSNDGNQPFIIEKNNRKIYAICNGEIYNYKRLCKKYNIVMESKSDCNIIPHLYLLLGIEKLSQELIGEFAFCICDINKETGETTVYASRDRFGVRPMYISGNNNEIVISSELKGSPFLLGDELNEELNVSFNVEQVKPANYIYLSNLQENMNDYNYKQYYNLKEEKTIENYFNIIKNDDNKFYDNMMKNIIINNDVSFINYLINKTLIKIVEDMTMSDRPIGCLLSGGLDSSLIASIASRFLKSKGKILNTFSIGLEGGTDEPYAKKVAEFIGSHHTHILLDNMEFVNAIKTIVIPSIETYDITTVRASTGQILISKWIAENTDIKVLLIGDGSDELTSGYMYFHNAPSSLESHNENIRLLDEIHYYDVLRADRGVASNGIEARVPYLDVRFVDLYLSLNKKYRSCYESKALEKMLLRVAFDDKENQYLPLDVLYRKKEAFSDGVSSMKKSWYVIIQEYANTLYTDEEYKIKSSKYNHCIPPTKEALYYRDIFEDNFGKAEITSLINPHYWLPKWSGNISEPSARILENYN